MYKAGTLFVNHHGICLVLDRESYPNVKYNTDFSIPFMYLAGKLDSASVAYYDIQRLATGAEVFETRNQMCDEFVREYKRCNL